MENMQNTSFIRELASSDKRVRDKALESLTLFIRSRRDLQLVELLKIWKGLFFCFYHSDRPLTQQSLARSLSFTLVHSLPEQTLQPFLRAFWITMSRDFHSLDRLRLDKYLYLIRCYVGVAFEIFLTKRLVGVAGREEKEQKEKGNSEGKVKSKERGGLRKRKRGEGTDEDKRVNETESEAVLGPWKELGIYLDMLEEGPLSRVNFDPDSNDATEDPTVQMHKGPDGLRYHLLDIWLDEIEKVAVVEVEAEDPLIGGGNENNGNGGKGDAQDTTSTAKANKEKKKQLKEGVPMELLLRPIVRLKEKSISKMIRKRAGDVLDDERLVKWGVREKKREEDEDEDVEWGGIDE
ncbi:hypothetical protein PAAG_03006 [Paracoccidioides lutzii Pb01]|uniref:Ribosomal RNA processing protein n=1 Tax=Paracoccidioides lutzii (strain ATCC MYA-826 / Pb01) TaxID=502779 RepID=C1GY52_PARBA|nr:hypothetical protein PAAG_03006 [Paracoccidioides lutzii Pb01]EEH41443.2 hypothetical protein PAAG_03006 [Paracoccidioides lutzii Pb01]